MCVLSLKFCQHVNEYTLEVIGEQANAFFLRELYLDGCDHVTDTGLFKLTKTRSVVKAAPNPNDLLNLKGSTYSRAL